MARTLKGYDGAVNGMNILHGVAVVTQRTPTGPERRVRTSAISPSDKPAPWPETEIEPIVERAIQVIGSREEAMRWLGTPVRALDYATPISRLGDPAGQEQVFALLTQLEHGVL
jgi:putative toxin-antitoxin system antitoxin component (TIGR02293 family)